MYSERTKEVLAPALPSPKSRFPLKSDAPLACTRNLLAGCELDIISFAKGFGKNPHGMLVGWVGSARMFDQDPDFAVPWLGEGEDIEEIILDFCIDEIHLLAGLDAGEDDFSEIIAAARLMGIRICLHKIPGPSRVKEGIDDGRQHSNMWMNLPPKSQALGRMAKRASDIVISGGLLAFLSPLFVVIMLAIRLDSRGSFFFRQPRVGMGRRQFLMWKFRTMVPNAEQLRGEVQKMNNARGISFKIFGDPRVTRVGALLRRWSLDELPQLFNVLIGEMSLVGPRPIPVWVGEQLSLHRYYRRFCVMSGISGWWQVNGRTQDFDAMAEKDLEYIDIWSFWTDVRIIAATLPAIVRGENAV